jgi:hypothetical protein
MEQQTQHDIDPATWLRFAVAGRTVELAVPADAVLGDVLPAVLAEFGPDCVEQGVDHEGWVVCRDGDQALDEESSVAGLSLRDGATLTLRSRWPRSPRWWPWRPRAPSPAASPTRSRRP